LAYRLRPVDLLAIENDRDFLVINPAGFIPALQDGETIMVESIAILEYLLARHGSGSRGPTTYAKRLGWTRTILQHSLAPLRCTAATSRSKSRATSMSTLNRLCIQNMCL
jgi:glutathione S-transferase